MAWTWRNDQIVTVSSDGSWMSEGPLKEGPSGYSTQHVYAGKDVFDPDDHIHVANVYTPSGEFERQTKLK